MQYNKLKIYMHVENYHTRNNFKLPLEADETWAFGHQDNYCLTLLHKKCFIAKEMEVTALLIQPKLKFFKNDALKTGMSL
jgi:hypothetical protein